MNRTLFISALLAVAVLVMGVGVGAASEVTLTLEGITADPLPNNAIDVYVAGNYAYVADYTNGLVIVDISDPANPTTVGNYPSRVGDYGYTAAAIGVAVSGNYAYVANWYDDLYIIDITDKTNPTLANTYTIDDGADSITISGDLAFIAAAFAGVDIIDISDPVNPVFLGNYNTNDLAEDIAIQNDYAYIADRDDGVIIVDVSDLANPSFVGSCDTPYDANSIVVSGAYAYVADADDTLIIDVSNPTSPAIVGQYDTTDSWGIAHDGNYVYVGDGDNGVVVLNVNDPTNPVLAGGFDTAGCAIGLDIVGDLVYVADGPLVILTTDASDTSAPPDEMKLTYIGNYSMSNIIDLKVSGNYLYVTDGSNFNIFDINANGLLSHVYTIENLSGYIAIYGDYAYIAGTNLSIIDIKDPEHPFIVGEYIQRGNSIVVSGDYAYVATYEDELLVFDIKDKINPLLIGSCYVRQISDIAVSGNYVYTTDGDNLVLIDVSDPTSPSVVKSYSLPGAPRTIAFSNNYIYLPSFFYGLVVFDVNDPLSAFIAGVNEIPVNAHHIAVSGNYAYIANSPDGASFSQANDVTVINVSNPSAPLYVGNYTNGPSTSGMGPIWDLVVSDDYIYVNDLVDGLVVLHIGSMTTGPVHNINKGTDYTTIQAAIDAANPGDEIHVDAGTYVENVIVDKQLALIGEGADMVIVQAADSQDHVIEVTADWVNISGFTVTGIQYSWMAGIYLNHSNYSYISDNNASNNDCGILIGHSFNNNLQRNVYFDNWVGISLQSSSYNILKNNNASRSDYFGIHLEHSPSNTIINNLAFSNVYGGISVGESSSENNLTGNTANLNDGDGIYIWRSNNCILMNNNASSNGKVGIILEDANISTLSNNIVENNYGGIYLNDSIDNLIYHNNIKYNTNQANDDTAANSWDSGYPSGGNYWSDYIGNDDNKGLNQDQLGSDGIGDTPYPIPGGSSVDNYPLMTPWDTTPTTGPVHNINKGTDYTTIQAAIDDASPGDEIHVDSGTYYENVVVNKQLILRGIDTGAGMPEIDASGNVDAIALFSDEINVNNFFVTNAIIGIRVNSNNNTLTGNIVSSNYRSGLYLRDCNNNTIINNTVINNSITGYNYGIRLDNSTNNRLIGNNVSNNIPGVFLYSSNNNVVRNNIINNNSQYGIAITYSNHNTFTGNNVTNNTFNGFLAYGMNLYFSNYNNIYHNNFINNDNGARVISSTNTWDNEYPSGGNFWDDYIGTDNFNGLNQDQSGSDGIGDTPYPIPGGSSVDQYPLMVPYTPPTSDYESKLIQQIGDFKVYLIEDGKKRHFTSPEALEWNGHSFDDVIEVSEDVINSFETGEDISITQTIIDKYNALDGAATFGLPAGTGEQSGYPDSSGVICTYVNFQNGAIEYFTNGDQSGNAYAILNPFFDKWASMGYAYSVLGYPISDMSDVQTSSLETPFKYQNFMNGIERGALEYNLNSGEVFEIHGAIYATWGAIGYAKSVLGAVTSDELPAGESPPPHETTGKYSKFENGTIHWISDDNSGHPQNNKAFITYGDLDEFYTGLTGTNHWLGFPVMNQTEVNGYGYCEFEGGYIEWDGSRYKAYSFSDYEGKLLKQTDDFNIYLIENGKKLHFTSPEALEWNGYSLDNVIEVSEAVMDSFEPGEDINIPQAIIDKYNELGGEATFGTPVGTGEKEIDMFNSDIVCFYVNFQKGSVEYFINGDLDGNVYAITDPFFSKWKEIENYDPFIYLNGESSNIQTSSIFETPYRYQNFIIGYEEGSLIYNISSGEVFEIHEAIYKKWKDSNFGDDALGLVTSDVMKAAKSPKGTIGNYSEFENGHIHLHDNSETKYLYPDLVFITYGALDDYYTSMKLTDSYLGFPVMDQEERDGHGYCEFEGGIIEWDQEQNKYLDRDYVIDLKITDILFEKNNPIEGEPISITAKIQNVGDVDANDFWVSFKQSSHYTDFGLEGMGINATIGDVFIDILASGESKEIQMPWNAAPVKTDRNGSILVFVDSRESINEGLNEKNNIKFGKIDITSRSKFKPEVDGYHFENFVFTKDERDKFLEESPAFLDIPFTSRNIKNIYISVFNSIAGRSGICYGMSSTAVLYYRDIPKPVNYDTTFDMMKNDHNVKSIIFDSQVIQILYQFPKFFDEVYFPMLGFPSSEYVYLNKEYNEKIKPNLDKDKPVVICIKLNDGGHAIVAYDVYEVSDRIKNILVYDNNYPGMGRVMQFDLLLNKINYTVPGYTVSYAQTMTPLLGGNYPSTIFDSILDSISEYLLENDKISISVLCPVNVSIIDQYGREINSVGTNTIPGATYSNIDDIKVFYVPAELDYTVNIDAYDSGNFSYVQMNPLTSESILEISFWDIPITYKSKAKIDVNSISSQYIMQIDYDGDGTVDEIREPDSIQILKRYNISFLPPITTMDQFNLTDGSTLPIKFTASNRTTDEFIYDDTVNVTITNSTGHLITYFTNGTGSDSVRINTEEEQYIVNFHSKNYDLNVGETYAITVTYGESDSLRGYDMTYFRLVERGKGKG